jgi:hypothetical protein
MERLVQWLDDLEDLYYAAALLGERIQQAVRFFLFLSFALAAQISGVLLALSSPPLAVGTASLLLVGMLYRSVVQKIPLAAAIT